MSVNAKVWTVSNVHSAADFTTLQDAIDGATAGDTIYIEGSGASYGSGILAKKLVIIGTGYWLNENDTTQVNKQHSQVGALTFNIGSEGSEIQGLYFTATSMGGSGGSIIRILTDTITIARNYFTYHAGFGSYNGAKEVIIFIGDRDKIIITQNWIEIDFVAGNLVYDQTVRGVLSSGTPTNCIISKNFIRSYQNGFNGAHVAISTPYNSGTDVLVFNNVIWGDITTYYTVHKNNILVSGSYNSGYDSEVYNNICNGTQYPVGNGNQQNVDMSTVFVDYVGYIDNDYFLASGSPAIGAGIGGGDCGAFGTYMGNPYILSGMPEIPAIFDATIGTFGTTVLPVNIKAISHH